MKILTARPHRLLEECVRRLGEKTQQGESCMFLVPSQYTLQAEIEIMERLHVKGSFRIDVLSPKRLQSRVFELAGMPKQTIFDERGKCMVLSTIIEEQKDELTIYRGAAQSGTAGFTARVSSMIASLKRSGLSAADVAESVQKMEEENPARAKLGDIARIYAAYEQRMAGELADAEDVSREMCARFAASGLFKGQNIFVYGFDMITPTFAAELLSMEPLCSSLTLAIETDANAAPDGRLFAPVNYSLERLEKLAKERGVAVKREVLNGELDAPTDIREMEKKLYALGCAPCMEEPTAIELHGGKRKAAGGVPCGGQNASSGCGRGGCGPDGSGLSQTERIWPAAAKHFAHVRSFGVCGGETAGGRTSAESIYPQRIDGDFRKLAACGYSGMRTERLFRAEPGRA